MLDSRSRRWTVIASGLLCGALAVVVLFTNRGAFFSPLAIVVMGAVGFAAVLLNSACKIAIRRNRPAHRRG